MNDFQVVFQKKNDLQVIQLEITSFMCFVRCMQLKTNLTRKKNRSAMRFALLKMIKYKL